MLFMPLALPQIQSIESRLDGLLSQMTIEEKLDMIGGENVFYIRGVPRLGIPQLKSSDGPAGVRNDGPTTAYPAPVCLAATWNQNLMRRYGDCIGRNSRARGVHVWLGPGVNLARIPQNGRNFEYFGEDPYLASRCAANVVIGVQSQGVAATVKHFAANDHENDRLSDSSEVDERTLRELYLRPFEAAVREGGVWAVMTGYNKLNGTYCSENGVLLNQILKKEWGFKGVAMSDWGAVHSVADTANGGLDLEMPNGEFMNRTSLLPLTASGEVAANVIDDKVRRILRMSCSMGFLDRQQLDKSIPLDDPASNDFALQIAREGIVLLKNDRGILPLQSGKERSIVVVGPNAEAAGTGGGGSAYTTPFRAVSSFDSIRNAAMGAQVSYVPLLANFPKGAYRFAGYEQGIHAEYFNSMDLSGNAVVKRTENTGEHDWRDGSPDPTIHADKFSARWKANFVAPKSGKYLFVAQADDGVRAFVDGEQVVDGWRDQGATTYTAEVDLKAGVRYKLRVEYYENAGGAVASFGFVNLTGALEEMAASPEIKNADAVIACVGFNPTLEGEGSDRPFDLPSEQTLMLEALAKTSGRVIVVVNSGAGVNMLPWATKVRAILQSWYPGQSGNTALAEIIFGDVNPSGKLPTTFMKSLAGTYIADSYPPKNRKVRYEEALLMGYRFYDAKHIDPLFPFGHGLSYTSFEYSDIKCHRIGDVEEITAWVKNVGARTGKETAQLYLGELKPTAARPIRELKGFAKISLRPGEKMPITFGLLAKDLAFWDVASHGWKTNAGKYEASVGGSSRSLPVKATFRW